MISPNLTATISENLGNSANSHYLTVFCSPSQLTYYEN